MAKARGQMEEQDDEIKKLNEVILNAKCHAIRDAQLKEKDDIRRAMEDEEVCGFVWLLPYLVTLLLYEGGGGRDALLKLDPSYPVRGSVERSLCVTKTK